MASLPRFHCDGLPDDGILVGDIKEEVPETLICRYFGPKSSKSGWKYNAVTTLEEQDAILSLYRRVYDVQEMPNKEITLQFARGLIFMSLQKKVNWSQFSVERRSYREALRVKKELTGRTVALEEGSTNLAKRRCVAPSTTVPSTFQLTPKLESCEVVGSIMGKKGIGGKKGGLVSPSWVKDDMDSMGYAIVSRSDLATHCRDALSLVSCERGALEDKLPRTKMLLVDREVMVSEAEADLVKFSAEEHAVLAKKRLGSLSPDPTSVNINLGSIDPSLGNLDALYFSKALAERTIRLSGDVILGCVTDISALEVQLKSCSSREVELMHKVRSLEGSVVGMNEQLKKMTDGGGATFWPRPISGSPELPVIRTHTLNACPVCCLWYSCWNYVPTSCGHCYHPWCYSAHTSRSLRCLVDGCNEFFLVEHHNALGVRHGSVASISTLIPKLEPPCRAERPLFTERSLEVVEELEKATPHSQSSATDVVISCRVGSVPNNLNVQEEGSRKKDTNCFLCRKKDAAVKLKACGHDYFCFLCIQGLLVCPVCQVRVSGWEPIRKKSSPTHSSDAEAVHATDVLDETPEASENSGDTDDKLNGNVEWSTDDVFREGGLRLVSPEEIDELTLWEVRTSREEIQPLNNEVGSESEEATPRPTTKKRSGSIKGPDNLNHTRLVKRTMQDLLVSSAPVVEKVATFATVIKKAPAADLGAKKKPGRPPKRSKESAAESTVEGRNARKVRQTVPAKFQDL